MTLKPPSAKPVLLLKILDDSGIRPVLAAEAEKRIHASHTMMPEFLRAVRGSGHKLITLIPGIQYPLLTILH
jgi:hypothetical protein